MLTIEEDFLTGERTVECSCGASRPLDPDGPLEAVHRTAAYREFEEQHRSCS